VRNLADERYHNPTDFITAFISFTLSVIIMDLQNKDMSGKKICRNTVRRVEMSNFSSNTF
jgi:DNA-binding response OmpR family regulator